METYLIIIIIIIIIICCCSSSIGGYLYTQTTPSNTQSTQGNTQSTPSKVQSTKNNTQSTPSIEQQKKKILDENKCTITLKPNTCYMSNDGIHNACSGTSSFIEQQKKEQLGKETIEINNTGSFVSGIKDERICGEKFEETFKKFILG